MQPTPRKPFFGRIGPALLTNAVMAAALTAISLLDVLVAPFGQWQVGQPAPTTYRQAKDQRCAVDELLGSLPGGATQPDRFLVRRSEPVSQAILDDLERQIPERKTLEPIKDIGLFVFYFLALVLFNLVLRRTGKTLDLRFRACGSLYLVLLVTTVGARLLADYTTLSLFAVPTALAVLLYAPLVRQTNALAIHLLAVALIMPLHRTSPGMMLIPLASGWAAALVARPGSGSLRLLLAALFGALVGTAALFGLDLFTPHGYDFALLPEGDLVGLAGGMLAAGVLAVVLRFPITRLAGGVPRSTLARLRDLEHPVLRDLAEKAPGTFQHTLSVANMAEKAAHDIGADDDLVRVGAYYHDIGKMRQPDYFSENQQGSNPHDKLSPADSAQKLRSHIESGLIIARGANLPERVIDFVIEHHGNSTMDYFLDKAARAAGREVDRRTYSYHGRNPTSRETATLMIVDSVEAASRTLKEPTHDQIENLVRQILFSKLSRGYLDDSNLTTRDLKRLGQSLIGYLEAQFHVRVEYPWQQPKPQAASPAAPAANEEQASRQAARARIATPIHLPAIQPDTLPGPVETSPPIPDQEPPAPAPDGEPDAKE